MLGTILGVIVLAIYLPIKRRTGTRSASSRMIAVRTQVLPAVGVSTTGGSGGSVP